MPNWRPILHDKQGEKIPGQDTVIFTEHIRGTDNAGLGLHSADNFLTLGLKMRQSLGSYLSAGPFRAMLQVLLESGHMQEVLHTHLVANAG